MCGASAAAHSAIRAANTGEDSSSSTAMPAHCAPWPGNTNTGRVPRPATPDTTPGTGAPDTIDARAASKSSRPAATTAARCSKRDRVTARE